MSSITRMFRVAAAVFLMCSSVGSTFAEDSLPVRIGPILTMLESSRHQAVVFVTQVLADQSAGAISEDQYGGIEAAYDRARHSNLALIERIYHQVEESHNIVHAGIFPVERGQFQSDVDALFTTVQAAYGADCTVADNGILHCDADFGITLGVAALIVAIVGVAVPIVIEGDRRAREAAEEQAIIDAILKQLEESRWPEIGTVALSLVLTPQPDVQLAPAN